MILDKYYHFAETVKGFNHTSQSIPNQDACQFIKDEELDFIALAVADGKENEPLSELGSKIAVKVACENIVNFVKVLSDSNIREVLNPVMDEIFSGINSNVKNNNIIERKNFNTETGCIKILNNSDLLDTTETIPSIRDFFDYLSQVEKSIVDQWNFEIAEKFNDLKTNNLAKLNEISIEGTEEDFSHLFGTTLLATVITPNYWFAIQIGDGTCITVFNEDDFNEFKQTNQPIPDDENCFENTTTLLSDKDACLEFRHCLGKIKPNAIFIGTGGIENSFHNENREEELQGIKYYYKDLISELSNYTDENKKNVLWKSLKDLTDQLSGDDVSIAGVITNSWVECKYLPKESSDNEINNNEILSNGIIDLNFDKEENQEIKENNEDVEPQNELIEETQIEHNDLVEEELQEKNNIVESNGFFDEIKEEIKELEEPVVEQPPRNISSLSNRLSIYHIKRKRVRLNR